MRWVIGARVAGPVFLRRRMGMRSNEPLVGNRRESERVPTARLGKSDRGLTRVLEAKLARWVWWDAGAVKADAVRTSFVLLMRAVGRPDSTCPKSWRHTSATLLRDANVDPPPCG